MPDPDTKPDYPHAKPPSEVHRSYEPCQPQDPELRIGVHVRSLVDDVNVSVGMEGLVVNVAPARYNRPARARVLWGNDTVSMADKPTLEILPKEESL